MRNVQRRTQLQRLATIVNILQSVPCSKKDIIYKLENIFNKQFSNSQIEKDIFCLKMDFDAEIIYNKTLDSYSINSEYNFKDALYNYVCL
jgi:hypothetical protein